MHVSCKELYVPQFLLWVEKASRHLQMYALKISLHTCIIEDQFDYDKFILKS